MSSCNCDIEIAEAWSLFEETLFNQLLEATSLTAGKNCFLGHMPSRLTNAVALKISGGDAEATINGCWKLLKVDCEIIGRFNERRKATDFIGLVLQHFSQGGFKEKANLLELYLESMPSITDEMVIIGNDPDSSESLHFVVNFACEAIFNTESAFSD